VKIEAGVMVCCVLLRVAEVDDSCVVEMVRRSPNRNPLGSVHQSLTYVASIDWLAWRKISFRPPMTMWIVRPILLQLVGSFGLP
jgi:hypothetical protein